MADTTIVTTAAAQQIGMLDENTRNRINAVISALDVATIRHDAMVLGNSPAGQLFRIRSGRVWLLVAVDGADTITLMGIGLRPTSQGGPVSRRRPLGTPLSM